MDLRSSRYCRSREKLPACWQNSLRVHLHLGGLDRRS